MIFSQGSSQCSKRDRSHDKLKQVLAETTPKLVKSVHLDYDLYLQVMAIQYTIVFIFKTKENNI